MAKFVWITFDRRAKAVLVEADDIEAAKAKVLEEHVQNRDEEETEEAPRVACPVRPKGRRMNSSPLSVLSGGAVESWSLVPGFRTQAQFDRVRSIVESPEFHASCHSKLFEPSDPRPYSGPFTWLWYDRSGALRGHADRRDGPNSRGDAGLTPRRRAGLGPPGASPFRAGTSGPPRLPGPPGYLPVAGWGGRYRYI